MKYFANGYTKTGVPDILACVDGHFLGIEVKASNGKPSPLQIHNLRKIDDAGGFAVLLYPDQFDQFKDLVMCMIYDKAIDAEIIYEQLKSKWKHFEDKYESEVN